MTGVRLDHGDTTLEVDLPADAVVVGEGATFAEPPALDDPVEATRRALAEPLGCPPIRDQVGPGSKVVIAFPDRVKGGNHATAHRRVAIGLLLDELAAAGVVPTDIQPICAIGLHRKNSAEDFADYLGPELVARLESLGPPGAKTQQGLTNHDPEDDARVVRLPDTVRGDRVEVNRAVVEADLAIMVGHAMGNPYGGYSGGYKMPCTGLTTWRSIAAHHTPATMHRGDFVPASTHSRFRAQLTEIGGVIEAAMGRPFFTVDAVLRGDARQLAVFAGRPGEVERAAWPIAARRTEIALPGEPFDVLVVGMPRAFHYGPGMGSNPILVLQAIGASIVRHAAALRPGAVVICASVCDGWFNDAWFPSYRETYDLFRRTGSVAATMPYAEELAARPEYLQAFRAGAAYHPFHAFSMLSMGGIALGRAGAIYLVGAESPEIARGLGCLPVQGFGAAVDAARRRIGRRPRMLVVPSLARPQVHTRVGAVR